MTPSQRNARARGVLTVAAAMFLAAPGSAVASTPIAGTVAGAHATNAVPAAGTACPDASLASLTEAQRIGQLFMVAIGDQLDAATRSAIANRHFGSITFAAFSTVGVAGIHDVSQQIQAQATQAATGGVRFLIAANQEGGLIQALSGPGFDVMPSALRQGKLTPAELKRDAARWATELGDAGLDLDLAPVADVVPPGTAADNAPIGQLRREYGHFPGIVASHVKAFITGMHEAGVATTVKHFPGLGRVKGNTDHTASVRDTVTTRHDPYLEPFAAAVGAGVPFVMVSLATYTRIDPAHLAAFSPTVIRGMLRGDLGFRGVVMSDSLDAAAVASMPPADRALDFVLAGGDMIIATQLRTAKTMAKALAGRASASPAFRRRIDAAALRVLRAKDALGLLPCDG